MGRRSRGRLGQLVVWVAKQPEVDFHEVFWVHKLFQFPSRFLMASCSLREPGECSPGYPIHQRSYQIARRGSADSIVRVPSGTRGRCTALVFDKANILGIGYGNKAVFVK